jgi:hypothetical protein
MLRNTIMVAVTSLAVGLMLGSANADTVRRGGPMKENPNLHAVVQLSCASFGWPDKVHLSVRNTLEFAIPAGRVVHWSYKVTKGRTPPSYVSGETPLSAPLNPGQWTWVSQAGANAIITRCSASVML